MSIAKYPTWDRALARYARQRAARNGLRPFLVALAIVGLVVAVMPGVAVAEFEPPGLNGAQLDLSNDAINTPIPEPVVVTGKGFTPNAVAQVFMCPAGATDLQQQCVLRGAAQTDANGAFTTGVRLGPNEYPYSTTVLPGFQAPDGTTVTCRSYGATQCAVAAATYDSTVSGQPTSQAEHYVCFRQAAPGLPGAINQPCIPRPPASTTTTLPPPSAEWEPVAPMNEARQRLATAVGGDGRIYALGGNEPDGDAISSAEVYDPCKNAHATWSSVSPMPTPRTEFAAATGPDGRIYAIGGRDRLNGTALATVDAYDPTTNTWSPAARLALPRSDLAAATGSDGRIYAIGGAAGGGLAGGTAVPTSTVEAYDVALDQWQVVAPLTVPRSEHGATVGPDGRIYVVGGGPNYFAEVVGVESYSPGPPGTPGVWEPEETTARLPHPRNRAITAGSDGLIYASGGNPGSQSSLRSTSVYDTTTKFWTEYSEALTTPRSLHGAGKGLDGRVYAIGGTDDPGAVDGPSSLSSAEALKVAPSACPAPPPVADFNGDRSTDIAVFRPASGVSFFRGQIPEAVAWGAEDDIPVPGDYNGDKQSDLAMFRPSNGVWYLRGQTPEAVAYGTDGDIPVPADYDGDQKSDVAVFRPSNGTWYIHQSATGTELAANYGISGDVPVPADYDGDRKADLAVFRPSNSTWYLRGQTPDAIAYGAPGDIPVPADYEGDGDADLGIFRPSNGTWYLRSQTPEAVAYGINGDIPVPSDYDGDGRADLTVFRPSNGTWYLENGEAIAWGTSSDIPLPLPYTVRNAYFSG